jgi:hypothetical protein
VSGSSLGQIFSRRRAGAAVVGDAGRAWARA